MRESPGRQPLDLAGSYRLLRRRRGTIAAIALCAMAAALIATWNQGSSYEAETEVLVRQTQTGPESPAVNLATEAELIASPEIAQGVVDELGLDLAAETVLRNLDVETPAISEVVTIRYRSDQPDQTAEIANAFATVYLEHRRQAASERIAAAEKALTERVRSAQARLADLQREAARVSRLGEIESARQLENEAEIQLFRLGSLEETLTEIQSEAGRLDPGQVVSPATVPHDASLLPILRNGIVGLLIGLIVGPAVVFLREHAADRFRRESEVELLTGLKVLGRIPEQTGSSPSPTLIDEPQSAVSEAYRALRITVQGRLPTGGSSLLVVSAVPDEGSMLAAANLALAAAEVGSRVVLMNADLRAASDRGPLGMSGPGPGLSELLGEGDVDVTDVLQATSMPTLSILPSGSRVTRPTPLLSSERFARLVEELEKEHDLVVIHGPHVLGLPDSLLIGTRVSGCLMVVDALLTERSETTQAQKELAAADVRSIGIALSRVDRSTAGY